MFLIRNIKQDGTEKLKYRDGKTFTKQMLTKRIYSILNIRQNRIQGEKDNIRQKRIQGLKSIVRIDKSNKSLKTSGFVSFCAPENVAKTNRHIL